MRLFIQIPCFNEADTLPQVVADLPRSLPGVDEIHVVVIDDGSTDGTAEVAAALGVDHVVRLPRNRGLATAFQTGLDYCLRAGADIIVNTDGDHQYPGRYIPDLIRPILAGQADMVVGDRQTDTIAHFSPIKRFLQRWGSWVVRLASGTDVPDATSGFRAFSREAALRLVVLTRYTYTLETLIQAGKKGLTVAHVPVTVNPPTRHSRLIRSTWTYLKHSAAAILRLYAFYEPLRTFSILAVPFLLAGGALILRFLYVYLQAVWSGVPGGANRYVQSVTIGGTLLTVGFLIFVFGVLADISSTQRMLVEEILYRQRKQELEEQAEKQAQCEDHKEPPPAPERGRSLV